MIAWWWLLVAFLGGLAFTIAVSLIAEATQSTYYFGEFVIPLVSDDKEVTE